jgi:hypothetical protein
MKSYSMPHREYYYLNGELPRERIEALLDTGDEAPEAYDAFCNIEGFLNDAAVDDIDVQPLTEIVQDLLEAAGESDLDGVRALAHVLDTFRQELVDRLIEASSLVGEALGTARAFSGDD